MTAIIIISITIGCIPALIIYEMWRKYVYFAFKLPILIDAYLKISAAIVHVFVSIQMARQKFAKTFPSGGIVHDNTDLPESVIPRSIN